MDAILRDGLLAGLPVAVAGEGPFADMASWAIAALGADIVDEGATVLVFDAGGGPRRCGRRARRARRRVGRGAPGGCRDDRGRCRRQGAAARAAPRDAHRAAARSGLENLARTLGIEWARFGIRTVTVLPGAVTSEEEVAQLVAYLASPAGDYFSGCAITLGAVDARGV